LPDEDGKPEPALMTELHIWDRATNCWMSERGGMPIRHPVFWWLPEVEVLPSLPQVTAGPIAISYINVQGLQLLVSEWERIARRKFTDAEETKGDPFGKRFIEHGAMCYFNCAQQIKTAIAGGAPLPLATRSKRQTLLQQSD
jgi:hypothetical protein